MTQNSSGIDLAQRSGKVKIETPWTLAWKRFKRNRMAIVGFIILIIISAVVILAPFIAVHDPSQTNLLNAKRPPDSEHILGTDRVGRDVFARILYGGRVSITVGLISMSIAVLIGTFMGLMAGFYGGWIDTFITRLVDVFTSIPSLVLAITVAAVWGPGLYKLMAVIGVISWPSVARLVRGQVLSLREREFILASRGVGASDMRVMFKHLFPNSIAPVIVSATLRVAGAILTEAGLSFLGLGVQPPLPSWGNMLQDARRLAVLEDNPWLWLPPGIMIIITVLSINFMGDGLRDALDPKQEQ